MKCLHVLLIFVATMAISCDDRFSREFAPMDSFRLDSSFVEILSENGRLFTTHFHPCEALGSASTWINHPDTSLYQPIVVIPFPFNEGSDVFFKIYFKSSTLPVDQDPDNDDLFSLISQTLETGFNKPPHLGDIIFYIRHQGKRYANSWDSEATGLASPPYIRDRTGFKMEVVDYQIVENDCRPPGSFPSVRLIADVEGFLVTSNHLDSLWIYGKMDVLISTSVF